MQFFAKERENMKFVKSFTPMEIFTTAPSEEGEFNQFKNLNSHSICSQNLNLSQQRVFHQSEDAVSMQSDHAGNIPQFQAKNQRPNLEKITQQNS